MKPEPKKPSPSTDGYSPGFWVTRQSKAGVKYAKWVSGKIGRPYGLSLIIVLAILATWINYRVGQNIEANKAFCARGVDGGTP
jgi:hypothetical protein